MPLGLEFFKEEQISPFKSKMLLEDYKICSSKFKVTNALRFISEKQPSAYLMERVPISSNYTLELTHRSPEVEAYIIAKKPYNYSMIFGNTSISGLHTDKLGFIGLNKVDNAVCVVRVPIEHKEIGKKKNGRTLYEKIGTGYAVCIVNNENGVVFLEEVDKNVTSINLPYKSEVRKAVSKFMINELESIEEIIDNEKGILRTKNLTGLYKYLTEDLIHVKFIMHQYRGMNQYKGMDSDTSLLGDSFYSFILNIKTKKVFNNRDYLTVYMLPDNLAITAYEKRLPKCRDARILNELIDLSTGNILLSDADIDITEKNYIPVLRNEGTKEQTISVYVLSDSREPIQIFEETKCIGKPYISSHMLIYDFKTEQGVKARRTINLKEKLEG